jgi:hypothetical protein
MIEVNKEKYTNQYELQTKTRALISDVQKGNRYIVMRYSKPVGVLLGIDDYCKITGKDCDKCREIMRKTLKKVNG